MLHHKPAPTTDQEEAESLEFELFEAGPGEGSWKLLSGETPVDWPSEREREKERERESMGYWLEDDVEVPSKRQSYILAPV
jgi:hypothetical protein